MADPKTTGKICVACKLPHGLLIQLYKPLVPNKPAEADGEPILLAGENSRDTVGGFGITENVDAARFAAWMSENKSFPAVRANLVFAEDTLDKVRHRAREQAKLVSGFEGLDPEHPPGGVMPDNYEGRRKAT